jgi:hypothetical protein
MNRLSIIKDLFHLLLTFLIIKKINVIFFQIMLAFNQLKLEVVQHGLNGQTLSSTFSSSISLLMN